MIVKSLGCVGEASLVGLPPGRTTHGDKGRWPVNASDVAEAIKYGDFKD